MSDCPHEWVGWTREDVGRFYVPGPLWVPKLADGLEQAAEFCVRCHVVRQTPGLAPPPPTQIMWGP